MTREELRELEVLVSNHQLKDVDRYLKEDKEIPFLQKIGINKAQARTFEFVNIAMLAWAFGNYKNIKEYKEVEVETKNKFRKVLARILNCNMLEKEIVEYNCSLFRDIIAFYVLTLIPKFIVEKCINFDLDVFKQYLIVNNLIGVEDEKKQIDELFNILTNEDFNKAIEFIKSDNLEKLVELIKEKFKCKKTKEALKKDDVEILLNSFSYKEEE